MSLSSFTGKWEATSSEDDKHQTFSFAGDGTLIIDPFEGRMLVGKVEVDGDYLVITDPKDPKVRVRVKAVWNGTNELSLHMDGAGKIIFLRRK